MRATERRGDTGGSWWSPDGRLRTLLFLGGTVVGAALLFKFPDFDIRLLGIGNHRYFLFHSAFFPLIVWLALRRGGFAAAVLLSAFALGVGAHLVTDVFQSKSIVFPIVGTLAKGTSLDDRLWEGANAAGCGLIAFRGYLSRGRGRGTSGGGAG